MLIFVLEKNKKLYSVIDLETTGGNAKQGRITEVAIYKFDGEKIVDEFHSLINPECSIPPFVKRLTGISDEMTAQAPKFYEVAKDIIQITERTNFVAHNVKFDYSFLNAEFASLGYNFKRERYCTLQLSQLLIPNLPSYSLGNLCNSLDIPLEGRHRAYGDALATVSLFKKLLNIDAQKVHKMKKS